MVDSATVASKNGFCSYNLYLHKKGSIRCKIYCYVVAPIKSIVKI